MTRHIIERFEQSERFFWSNISLGTAQIKGTELFASGVRNPYLNCAIQRRLLTEATFSNTLDTIRAFYESHNVPWVWIVREDLIEPSLTNGSMLQLLDKSTMMYCYLKDLTSRLDSRTLQIIEDNEDLSDWGICLNQAYESSSDATTQYLEVINQYIQAHHKETWGKTKFHHFVAYHDKTPVSCLTLSLQNATARLDDIGTIPSQQNKGFATELITHVLNHAQQLGADICFLESSQMGINLYKKIGFRPLSSNNYFTVPEKHEL
jgi:ribosomal protein S18 acetylase RimI-like enzyme